ncbi:MAG: coiled-coil protein, partial [Candidatus Bathyarchaeia archaeon]
MVSDLFQKASQLESELAKIREQRDNLNDEARKWSEKRNEARRQIVSITEEAEKIRKIRDELNTRVAELKKQRVQKQTEVSGKRSNYLTMQNKMNDLTVSQPLTERAARKKFHELEWLIQTSRLSPKDEQKIIQQVKNYEKQLAVYRTIKDKETKLQDVKLDLESSRLIAKNRHTELSEVAEESQRNHEEMLTFLRNASELKTEARNAHQNFVETRRKADEAHKMFVELLTEKRMIDGQIRASGKASQL